MAAYVMSIRDSISTGGWTLGSQAVSSLSNFVLVAAVGRWASAEELGVLTLVLLGWLLALGVSRALVSQPMAIRVDAGRPDRWLSSQLTIGVAGSVVSLVVTSGLMMTGIDGATAVLALAFVLPGVLIQDLWRWVGFSQNRPAVSFVNDLVFLLVQLAGLAILAWTDRVSASTGILAWGSGAWVGSLYGARQFRVPLSSLPRVSLNAAREEGSFGIWMAMDFLSNFAIGQGYLVVVSVAATAELLGGWRAVQNLVNPVNVLVLGLGASSTAISSRRFVEGGPRPMETSSRRFGILIGLGVAAYGFVYVAVGGWLVPAVYGPAYRRFTVLIPYAAADALVRSLRHIPQIRLQVLRAPRRLAVGKAVAALPTLALSVLVVRSTGTAGPGLAAVLVALAWTASAWIAYLTLRSPASVGSG